MSVENVARFTCDRCGFVLEHPIAGVPSLEASTQAVVPAVMTHGHIPQSWGFVKFWENAKDKEPSLGSRAESWMLLCPECKYAFQIFKKFAPPNRRQFRLDEKEPAAC